MMLKQLPDFLLLVRFVCNSRIIEAVNLNYNPPATQSIFMDFFFVLSKEAEDSFCKMVDIHFP